jgi:small membrane protein
MKFTISQIILIVLILLFALYVFRIRTILTDRIVYFILAVSGIVLVLYPDLSSKAANYIGIGRGTDLILYMFIIFMLFNYVSMVSRFKIIERQLTIITRKIAIDEALDLTSLKEDKPSLQPTHSTDKLTTDKV